VTDATVLASLMRTALGEEVPDLVVRGGRVVNVFTGEIRPADVWIKHGRIASLPEDGKSPTGGEVLDVDGAYLCPGLIDAHFHMGGSHLDPAELARALLARGTTALATDFYEIYCTTGPQGVRLAIEEATRAGLKLLFLAPAHLIGLEQVGTFGWQVCVADMLEMLRWPQTVGVMEPPASAILAGQPGLLEVVSETFNLGKVFAGHAPGETGLGLQAYLATGATSDHESGRADEAWTKLRFGMRPMMRESSAAPDLANLIELAREHPSSSRYMMLCSDETDPGDLVRKGHMDTKVRMAVAVGINPVTAVQMATINVAEYFGVAGRTGSLAPGAFADLVVVEDLGDFRPSLVVASGKVVARDCEPLGTVGSGEPAAQLVSRINVPRPLEPADFVVDAASPPNGKAVARVIGVQDGSLISNALERSVRVEDGVVRIPEGDDLLKIAVIERHQASGRIGKGFVQGFGFRGAVALTYCHVFHNLLVIGSSDEQMALAANTVREMGGGIAVVSDRTVAAHWRLPMIGVLDTRPLAAVQRSFDEINEVLRTIGCGLQSPILSLSFIALPTIPAYGLTDRGLFDVAQQRFVDLLLQPAAA
jgi:adenine deaminase